jgi:hypothetical protein
VDDEHVGHGHSLGDAAARFFFYRRCGNSTQESVNLVSVIVYKFRAYFPVVKRSKQNIKNISGISLILRRKQYSRQRSNL